LLGGVILGTILSNINYSNSIYYDGYRDRSYHDVRRDACYETYYRDGRRVLLEVPYEYCRAY
jgi:hypothetical protein